jgi:ribosomal protein S18 acetylase RimI-like enzyme
MSIGVRFMRDGQEEAVAAMVRQMPKDLGLSTTAKLTGEGLRAAKGLVNVTVAEDSGLLLGACLWLITFSTWRNAKGMYVVDLYVMGHARGRKIGDRLLRGAAREAQKLGAEFMKLEVDIANVAGQRFYERFGFVKKPAEQLHILEPDVFDIFAKGGTL